MKSFALLATLVSFAMAAPAGLALRAKQCPTIPQIATTGQLPPGSLSPTFLLPVSQKKPNKAFPAGQSAIVTPHDKCTLTKFDIPASAQNKTCSLVLFLGGCGEEENEKGPGNISFQGNLGIRFPVPGQTTWNNQPPLAPPFTDAPVITLGNAYRLGGGPCDYTPGQAFKSVGGSICSNDTTLSFTQSNGGHGKCPVGFHIIIS
ncbi:Nn.00g103730.m01.CDS01 [Neocucurbitaria sp. VM-36]